MGRVEDDGKDGRLKAVGEEFIEYEALVSDLEYGASAEDLFFVALALNSLVDHQGG